MKIVEKIDILNIGEFSKSSDWKQACIEIEEAIHVVDWPHGTGKFTILPRKHANGVVPIKEPCIKKLESFGWKVEGLPDIEKGLLRTGDLDALYKGSMGYIGFEWETGNISSSHRAINKLLITLKMGGIKGGFLVVPGNKLYPYLTDRIGNIGELRPYFPLWTSIQIPEGCLRIIVVEHDQESMEVPAIEKGTDGWAKGINQS